MHAEADIRISPAQRGARVLTGAAGVVIALLLLVRADSVPTFVLEGVLGAGGFDLLVSGVLGYGPLWRGSGSNRVTASQRQGARGFLPPPGGAELTTTERRSITGPRS